MMNLRMNLLTISLKRLINLNLKGSYPKMKMIKPNYQNLRKLHKKTLNNLFPAHFVTKLSA